MESIESPYEAAIGRLIVAYYVLGAAVATTAAALGTHAVQRTIDTAGKREAQIAAELRRTHGNVANVDAVATELARKNRCAGLLSTQEVQCADFDRDVQFIHCFHEPFTDFGGRLMTAGACQPHGASLSKTWLKRAQAAQRVKNARCVPDYCYIVGAPNAAAIELLWASKCGSLRETKPRVSTCI